MWKYTAFMKMFVIHTALLLSVLCATAHALSLKDLIRELQNIQGSIEQGSPSSHQGAPASYSASSGGRPVYEAKRDENYIVETNQIDDNDVDDTPTVEAPPPDFCITEGYFLPMPEEQCKYLQCVVHNTQWSDAYGNVNIDTMEKHCPSGTEVAADFRGGYHPPCTKLSSQCSSPTPEPSLQEYDMRESARQIDVQHATNDDFTPDYSPPAPSVGRGGMMNRPPPPHHHHHHVEPSVHAYTNHVDAESEDYDSHYHSEFVHQGNHIPADKPPKKKKKMEEVAKLMMMVLNMMKDIDE